MGVGKSGLSDTPIMAYQLQQNALLPLLARTLVLNCGFNKAKSFFANPQGQEHALIRNCCAVKTTITWHSEKMGTICRERCGGGSFLRNSAIPEALIGAHSGMTAEGDNRVLMQKIVKDILSNLQQDKHDFPKMTQCPLRQISSMDSIATFETLKNLIFYKEVKECQDMGELLKKKIMEQGKQFFDVWQYEVSDEMQSMAHAFNERFVLQGALEDLENSKNESLKALLERSIFLHMITLVRENLGWYLMQGCVSKAAATNLDAEFDRAVKNFLPHMNTAVEGLGVFNHTHLIGPIARDYVAFTAQDDAENMASAGPLFNFKTTGIARPKL